MRRGPPYVVASSKGSDRPPAPFGALADYAVAQMRAWGGGYPNAKIQAWSYVRSKQFGGIPGECLLHLTDSKKGGYCAHRKCEHKSQKAIVTLDLMSGRAWHRCWDDDCVVGGAGGPKAKHELPRPPAAAVPPLEELLDFELRQGLRGPRGGGDEDGGDDPPTQE